MARIARFDETARMWRIVADGFDGLAFRRTASDGVRVTAIRDETLWYYDGESGFTEPARCDLGEDDNEAALTTGDAPAVRAAVEAHVWRIIATADGSIWGVTDDAILRWDGRRFVETQCETSARPAGSILATPANGAWAVFDG